MRIDNFLTQFKSLPPLWHPKPQKQRYSYHASVVSPLDPEVGYTLTFSSEAKAKAFKKAVELSTSRPIVHIERRPVFQEGYIE